MATILSCGACSYPIIFKGIAPAILAEKGHCIICPQCGAAYDILIRMIRQPAIDELEEIARRRDETFAQVTPISHSPTYRGSGSSGGGV